MLSSDDLLERPVSPEMVIFYITQDTQRHPLLLELKSGVLLITFLCYPFLLFFFWSLSIWSTNFNLCGMLEMFVFLFFHAFERPHTWIYFGMILYIYTYVCMYVLYIYVYMYMYMYVCMYVCTFFFPYK